MAAGRTLVRQLLDGRGRAALQTGAELQIVKGRDGVLTACLDSETASQLGPQDGYRVNADLPIQVIQTEQMAPCNRTS